MDALVFFFQSGAGAARASWTGAVKGLQKQAKAVRHQGVGAASAVSAVFQPQERQPNHTELQEQEGDLASESDKLHSPSEASKPQSPSEASLQQEGLLGKYVVVVGGDDHNVGKQGVVVGFDAEGDPQVRLGDGTQPFFCRSEIIVYDDRSPLDHAPALNGRLATDSASSPDKDLVVGASPEKHGAVDAASQRLLPVDRPEKALE